MTKIPNALTEQEISVASLISKGWGELEAGQEVGMSRAWVTKLKKRVEFQECVKEFSESFKQTILQAQEEQWLQDIKSARDRMTHARTMIFQVSNILMDKLLKRLETVDIEELKTNSIPQAVKNCADTFVTSIEIDNQITGIDRLIAEIKSIKKITGDTINVTPSNLNDDADSSD